MLTHNQHMVVSNPQALNTDINATIFNPFVHIEMGKWVRVCTSNNIKEIDSEQNYVFPILFCVQVAVPYPEIIVRGCTGRKKYFEQQIETS